MFANLQPNRRQLTWYSAAGRKGPWPSTPAIEHSDSKAQRTMICYTELRAMKTVGQARLELIAVKQT